MIRMECVSAINRWQRRRQQHPPPQVAVSLGTPIMTKDWINTAWQHRHDTQVTATAEAMVSPASVTSWSGT